MKNYNCYIDGCCEPKNPGGTMGFGIYVIDDEGNEYKYSNFIPAKSDNTNNIAEYLALTQLLKTLNKKTGCEICIFSDSKMVVMQMLGKYRISSGAYVSYALEAQALLKKLLINNSINIMWIPREYNEIADELSKAHILKSK